MTNLFFPLTETYTQNKGVFPTFLQRSLYSSLIHRDHATSATLCCRVWDGQEFENQLKSLTGYFLEDLSICEGHMMLSREKKVLEL